MSIGLFVVSWFAVGFLVALALGKILRESNDLGDENIRLALSDTELHLAEPAGAPLKVFRRSDSEETHHPVPGLVPATRKHSDTKPAAR
ncbi:MAG: hypothetical protein BMS9Abin10_0621 [Gammaproteobacteria bacterium]|nr:MAG: hypothetical protein BMS9Abin10_0621 [Gammaproteobacteria bacterium]